VEESEMIGNDEPPNPDTPVLVFGDDGSPSADVAWLWVNNHAWPGWRIEAVHAQPVFPPEQWGPPVARAWRSPWGRVLHNRAGVASVQELTADADPRPLLGDRRDAQLLVVGPRGLGNLRGLALGSTTDWLLYHPPAPLAIIRSAAAVERAVVAFDGSPAAIAALDAFLRLPLSRRAHVTLLSVDDGSTDVEAGRDDAMASFAAAGVGADAEIVAGKAARAIVHHLDEHRPQFVVLGTRGFTRWKRLGIGSTASSVVRAAPCSSLVVGAPGGGDETGESDDTGA
jgi:nucleotide-binding universal stress UspA family protein